MATCCGGCCCRPKKRAKRENKLPIAERTPRTCHFFRLLQELRDAIYIEAVVDKYYLTQTTPEPPLAKVCKQLRREVRKIYYTKNAFKFTYGEPGSSTGLVFTNFADCHLLRDIRLEFPISYGGDRRCLVRIITGMDIEVDPAGGARLTGRSELSHECTCELQSVQESYMDQAEEGEGSTGLVQFMESFETNFGEMFSRTAPRGGWVWTMGEGSFPWAGNKKVCGECGKPVWSE